MKIALAENERIIKEWEYGRIKQRKSDPITKTILLTDKRVISESSTPYRISRVEIANADIEGVETAYGQQRILPLFIIAFLGLIVGIVGIAIKTTAVIVVGFLVAALFGVLWWFLRKSGFAVVIYKRIPEELAFGLGVSADTKQKRLRFGTKKHREPKIRIKVDNAVAREIAETISANLF